MLKKLIQYLDKYFVIVTLTPLIIAISAAVLYPFFLVLKESMYIDQPMVYKFNGLGNYQEVLTDPKFYGDFIRTLKYSGFSSLFSFLGGLGLALALNQRIKARNLFRTWALYPWAIPPVVAAFIFKWFFNEVYGAANSLVMGIGLVSKPIAWLSNPNVAMPVLIGCDVWIRIPFVTVILLAGLQTVPQELYEAGRIDGASSFKLFTHITLPYLVAPIRVAMLVVTMFSFRMIDIMLMLTGGGPGRATNLFAAYIYDKGFYYLRFGQSAAAGVIMFVVIILIVGAYTYFLKPKVKA